MTNFRSQNTKENIQLRETFLQIHITHDFSYFTHILPFFQIPSNNTLTDQFKIMLFTFSFYLLCYIAFITLLQILSHINRFRLFWNSERSGKWEKKFQKMQWAVDWVCPEICYLVSLLDRGTSTTSIDELILFN